MFGRTNHTDDEILKRALNTLNSNLAEAVRSRKFKANQQAIEAIKKVSPLTTCGNLQLNPNIDNMSANQPALPLVHSDSIVIDLNKLPVLLGAIQKTCRDYGIEFDRESDSAATFTAVMTTVAGQHDITDADCSRVTAGEFVPVYTSHKEQRVIALCYPTNGSTPMRMDHIKVNNNKLTCIGRKSNSSSGLKAIEIPNLMAVELKDTQHDVFEKLKSDSCLVAFVEYDLIPKGQYSAIRGGTMRGGGSTGVSAYSVMVPGTHTDDTSRSITEEGTRKLSKVSVYAVSAIVVNTNEQTLTPTQCENIVALMKARAAQLQTPYLPYETYTFNHLLYVLNDHLEKYGVNSHSSDIFEHSLLRLADIKEPPTSCRFAPSTLSQRYCVVSLGLSEEAAKTFANNLRRLFNYRFTYVDFCNQTEQDKFKFSLLAISKIMPDIKKTMDLILSDPRALKAYQKYSSNEKPTTNDDLSIACWTHSKSTIYHALVRAFDRQDESMTIEEILPGSGYVEKMMCTAFSIQIQISSARTIVDNLVDSINKQFPRRPMAARSVTSKAPIYIIEIDNDLLCSSEFIDLLKRTKYTDELTTLATKYLKTRDATQPAESDPNFRLGNALFEFAAALSAPQQSLLAKYSASDKVRRELQFFGSRLDDENNQAFKRSDKMAIKAMRKDLALR